MPFRRVPALVLLLGLTSVGLSSCLVKRRLITRTGAKTAAPTLLVADRAELIQKIAEQFQAIRNFSATVDMVPALGTAEKSRITEYKDVRGYILFRQPGDIRIIIPMALWYPAPIGPNGRRWARPSNAMPSIPGRSGATRA